MNTCISVFMVHLVSFLYRKAVLPIEAEAEGSQEESNGSDGPSPKSTIALMKSVGNNIHSAAKSNIDLAQIRYKKDHDKKFCPQKGEFYLVETFESVLSPL